VKRRRETMDKKSWPSKTAPATNKKQVKVIFPCPKCRRTVCETYNIPVGGKGGESDSSNITQEDYDATCKPCDKNYPLTVAADGSNTTVTVTVQDTGINGEDLTVTPL
jgi:hypothetical protein